MSTKASLKRKRSKQKTTSQTNIHTDSIDISSDLSFFLGSINSNDIFLRTLLSGQITNFSISNLYNRSLSTGWKEILIDLRNNLKLDDKPKPKRFLINRLIDEYSRNNTQFDIEMMKLNEQMKKQLSMYILPEQEFFNRSLTINDVYNEIQKWRKLQCERRLFYKEYNQRCSFIVLQQIMTDHLINLLQSSHYNAEVLQKFLDHCLIIVVQPSGTDCLAVTKYEKIGDAFMAKIKTRIICLLDPDRIRQYLELSNVGVKLYLKDRAIDPDGDLQSELVWKTRTITSDNNEKRKFSYVEINENDEIRLTKKNSNKKLLYNKQLCQLEFFMKFKFIGINFETSVKLNSQFFGLCSHGKYSSKYLTKVFLEEVNESYKYVHLDTNIVTLEGYIYEFYRCITGVDAKIHTRKFIHDELSEIYKNFQISASSCTGPVMFFKIDIYEDVLEKLISQMKFMGSHPFLSMMYFDSLFLGICSDQVDSQLDSNILKRPQLLMRFASSTEQLASENPNIIFAIHNRILVKSRVIATHGYLVRDMCTCICAAAQSQGNEIQVYDYDKTSPFSYFEQYYDPDLSHDNLIQTNNETKYFALSSILRNTIPNDLIQCQTSPSQQHVSYTFDLTVQLIADENLKAEAIAHLKKEYASWCQRKNAHGSLALYSLENFDINVEDWNQILDETDV